MYVRYVDERKAETEGKASVQTVCGSWTVVWSVGFVFVELVDCAHHMHAQLPTNQVYMPRTSQRIAQDTDITYLLDCNH